MTERRKDGVFLWVVEELTFLINKLNLANCKTLSVVYNLFVIKFKN